MFTKALAAALFAASLSACATVPEKAWELNERSEKFIRMGESESAYLFALQSMEKAVDARRLTLTEVQELQYYLSRSEVALEKMQQAYDAKDDAEFEKSIGQVQLNTERMRAIVFPRSKP